MKNLIVVVSALFPPEPVVSANLSFDIATELCRKNDVLVLSPKPSRPLGMNFSDPVTMNEMPFKHIVLDSFTFPDSKLWGRLRESYSLGKLSARFIRNNHEQIKLIYANTWPLFAQYFLVKAAMKYSIPVVLHVQDIYPDSLAKKLPAMVGKIVYSILLPIDRYILKHSKKVIAISQDMIKYLSESRKIGKEKFALVRNWQNDSHFNVVNDNGNVGCFTFMYLGSISSSAGVEILLNGYHKANIKNSQLIIAGSGSDKEKCIALANQLQNENIRFIEAPPDDVAFIQSQADILLLPLKKGISLTASPSKLTAYMLSGKPVIACVEHESDTAKNILLPIAGFVSAPEDVDELSYYMQRAVQIPTEDLVNMGQNGRNFALKHLSKEANLRTLIELIETVKNGN